MAVSHQSKLPSRCYHGYIPFVYFPRLVFNIILILAYLWVYHASALQSEQQWMMYWLRNRVFGCPALQILGFSWSVAHRGSSPKFFMQTIEQLF